MNSVNLNEFLSSQSKNFIIIMYNEEYFNQVFDTANGHDFLPLKGKWLFVEYKDGVGKFVSPQEFMLNEQDFDINSFYNILELSYKKWQILMPNVPFPDIQIGINSHDRSAFLSYDKTNTRHMIFLGLKDLESLEKFKFTIGHELGHLYYFFSGLQEKVNLRLKQKQFSDFMPWTGLSIGLTCILFNAYTIFQNAHILISLFSLVQIVGWILYLSTNIFSRKRLENYSMEFFSDFFSISFLGKPLDKNYGLSEGGWNCYTHPAGNWRLSLIKNTPENCLLHEWDNPVERYAHKFKFLNLYEMEFTLAGWFYMVVNFINEKTLNLINKKRKT